MATAPCHDDHGEPDPCYGSGRGAAWLDAVIARRLAALEMALVEQWRRLAPDEYDRAMPGARRSAATAACRMPPGLRGRA